MISKIAWQCLNAWMFLLNCFTIIYLGIYGQWSHLHLAVILAQLTCGCVTRRAAPRPPGHVTGTGPGRLVLLLAGRALRQNQLPRAMDPARWDLRPGLGSGVGTIKSGCWLHSLTPMSKSSYLPSPRLPRLAGACQTWNQFEPRGVILALLGSPLATSGAMAGPS